MAPTSVPQITRASNYLRSAFGPIRHRNAAMWPLRHCLPSLYNAAYRLSLILVIHRSRDETDPPQFKERIHDVDRTWTCPGIRCPPRGFF